jgi:uncharacterized protein
MTTLLVFIGIGALAGVFAGMLGVGGGLVVVPLLASTFYQLGFPTNILIHLAIGSSLASMVVTTFFSTWSHHRNGVVMLPTFKLMAGGVVLGSIIGPIIASFFHSTLLGVAFGVFAILVALQIFFNVEWRAKPGEPDDGVTRRFSLVIGMVSSMLGIGAGSMGVPFLLSYRKMSIHQAVGNTAALSFAIALVGALTYYFTGVQEPDTPAWATGYIYWPAVLGVSLGSPLSAWGSANAAHLLPIGILRRIFAVFLFVVGIRMLFF